MPADVTPKERRLRNELAKASAALAVEALEYGDRAYEIGRAAIRLQAAYDAYATHHVTGFLPVVDWQEPRNPGETGTPPALRQAGGT